jgi:hypothetical protein
MAVAGRCTTAPITAVPAIGGTGRSGRRSATSALHQLGPRREALGPYLADRGADDRLDHQCPGRAGVGGQQPAVAEARTQPLAPAGIPIRGEPRDRQGLLPRPTSGAEATIDAGDLGGLG